MTISPRRYVLGCLCVAMLVLWLGVLPRLSRLPAIRRHIERNRARQIEADAMFYTEVGPLEGITVEHRHGSPQIGRIRMSPPAQP